MITVGWVMTIAVVALGIGFALDRLVLSRSAQIRVNDARKRADEILRKAGQEAEKARLESLQRGKQEVEVLKKAAATEQEDSIRALRRSKRKLEKGLRKVGHRARELDAREEEIAKGERLLDHLVEEQTRMLEEASGTTGAEARQLIHDRLLKEVELESASEIKEIRDAARLRANREARKVILTAIQRTAASHTIENTVSVVNIPSDDMKGRIIGREGRNIRAFETETGVEVIVDDTPEAVVLSGFDPVRRETARLALIRLIQDGRIHPARIEEVVAKVRSEIEDEIIETGERAVIDLQLYGLHAELVRLVGRMRHRTSYGQNLLKHSIEAAHIASLVAAELNLDAGRARRAGLLHDIGKVIQEDIERSHALAGMKMCEKYDEHPDVCNAVGAHHDEIEMTSFIAPIVQAADAISGARPGARREALGNYIKRLEKLEKMAASFHGVKQAYAIQAGREIRVLVDHDLLSDAQAEQLSSDISKKIQQDMQYPGYIKVTVIREFRSMSYAR